MIPWPGIEAPFWRKDAFWAGVYLLVMLYAVVRGTWGKDEAARKPVLHRVLIAGGAFWLVVHVWAAWSLVTDLRGLSVTLGPRLTPMDQSRVVDDARPQDGHAHGLSRRSAQADHPVPLSRCCASTD